MRTPVRTQYQLTLFEGAEALPQYSFLSVLDHFGIKNPHMVQEDGKVTISFSATIPPSTHNIREALKKQGIKPAGIAVQSVNQHIRAAFFDMDSTIIQNECIDEMARMCDLKNNMSRLESENNPDSIYRQVHDYTKRAMELRADKAPPFEQALHDRLKIIADAGFRQEWLDEIYDKEIKLTEGAEALLKALKEEGKGIHTVLVSGGFTFFTQKLKDRLGFDEHFSNELQFDPDGFLIREYGKAAKGCTSRGGRIIGKEEKRDIVSDTLELKGIPANQALFGGDGGNDSLAAKRVSESGGIGVAYDSSNPDLLAAANVHLEKGQLARILDLNLEPLVSKKPAILAL